MTGNIEDQTYLIFTNHHHETAISFQDERKYSKAHILGKITHLLYLHNIIN